MAGDLVKCIKIDYIDGEGNPSQLSFEIGKSYRIESVTCDERYGERGGRQIYRSVTIGGYKFGVNDGKIYLRQFSDYFMTCSDWREFQLDKLL